jgi:hypothetical protein
MKRKLLDLLLFAGLVIGGVSAWRSGVERSRLERKYRRLSQITGELRVEDASRLNLLALETGDPLHFAWRVYIPPKYEFRVHRSSGGGGSSSSSAAKDIIGRVRLREDEEGQLLAYTHFGGFSTKMGIADQSLAAFLHGRQDRIRVERLASTHLEMLPTGRSAVLLRLSFPEEMREEARQALTPHVYETSFPVFYELTVGPDPPPADSPNP